MSNPEVVPRSYWTPTSRGGSAIVSSGVDGIAYHWPASVGQKFGVESKSKVASRLRGWRNYHVSGRGWSDIGYNLGVDMAGRVWDLRGLYRVGAHCASTSNPRANHHYIGILLIMGTLDKPTDAMIRAFTYARTVVVYGAHGSDANTLYGHRQVPGAQTACPGDTQIAIKGQLDNPYREEEEDDDVSPKNWDSADWAAFDRHVKKAAGDGMITITTRNGQKVERTRDAVLNYNHDLLTENHNENVKPLRNLTMRDAEGKVTAISQRNNKEYTHMYSKEAALDINEHIAAEEASEPAPVVPLNEED